MKISRILGLAVIAMLVFGSIAVGVSRVSAQAGSTPQPQAQGTELEGNDVQESPDAGAPDADKAEGGEESGSEDGTKDENGPDDQSPSYSGSITADQAKSEGMTEVEESTVLSGLASISEEGAKAAALAVAPGMTVVKVELDNENGVVVYSVELSDGSDVKIDAGNAAVLHIDTGGDNEG